MSSQAIILLAHGSRDPLWREPIESLAKQIRAKAASHIHVACAYLEYCPPDIHSAIAELVETAPTLKAICVLPLFLGMGRHAREDIAPAVAELKERYPKITWKLLPAAGHMPEIQNLLAKKALEALMDY